MKHPDDVIGEDYRKRMRALARALDETFNGSDQRKVCFTLLITEFGNMAGRVNYISNGQRSDIVTMLKEVLARFEGQPELKGRA